MKLLVLFILACAGQPTPAPATTPAPPLTPPPPKPPQEKVTLEQLSGKWELLTKKDGQEVIYTPCNGENPMVEVKLGPPGQLIFGFGQDATIMEIQSAEPQNGGVKFILKSPLFPTAALGSFRWLEVGKIGSFVSVVGRDTSQARYAAPNADFPRVAQPASECEP